ncbi:SGNH/GDSL hydrolase family protein, partial [Acinetobacter baumannii]
MSNLQTKVDNAIVDMGTVEQFSSGDEFSDVISRLGRIYPTLAKAIRVLMETGGWKAYSTEAELLATVPTVNPSVGYAFDTKKLYKWNGTAWIDEGLSQLDQANDFTK